MTQTKEISQIGDIEWTNTLKGMAIVAVLALHTFSNLPWGMLHLSPSRELFIALDQLSRFCVPIFIFLSGFGLGKKYTTSLNVRQFYSRRVVRLIPSYILWSLVLWAVLSLIPEWSGTGGRLVWSRLPTILAFGQADYQMYFIPVLLQLYVLFPVIHFLLTKRVSFGLILGFGIQVTYFLIIQSNLLAEVFPRLASSDYLQYSNFFAWVWYFVLGVCLAQLYSRIKKHNLVLGVTTLIFLCGAIFDAVWNASRGVDLLLAQKFTRFPVLLYATAACVWVSAAGWVVSPLFRKFFARLGYHSLAIFFAHTIVLRVIFGLWNGKLSATSALIATLVLLVTCVVQYKYVR